MPAIVKNVFFIFASILPETGHMCLNLFLLPAGLKAVYGAFVCDAVIR